MVLLYNHKITDQNCKTDASRKHSVVISFQHRCWTFREKYRRWVSGHQVYEREVQTTKNV